MYRLLAVVQMSSLLQMASKMGQGRQIQMVQEKSSPYLPRQVQLQLCCRFLEVGVASLKEEVVPHSVGEVPWVLAVTSQSALVQLAVSWLRDLLLHLLEK